MQVVGGVKKMKVNIFELDLYDMYNKQYSIWGYGIDSIIDPDEPVAPMRFSQISLSKASAPSQ